MHSTTASTDWFTVSAQLDSRTVCPSIPLLCSHFTSMLWATSLPKCSLGTEDNSFLFIPPFPHTLSTFLLTTSNSNSQFLSVLAQTVTEPQWPASLIRHHHHLCYCIMAKCRQPCCLKKPRKTIFGFNHQNPYIYIYTHTIQQSNQHPHP